MSKEIHRAGADPKRKDLQAWLSGLFVILATVVSFIGFARVSVGWTLVISSLVLAGLIAFLWVAGGKK